MIRRQHGVILALLIGLQVTVVLSLTQLAYGGVPPGKHSVYYPPIGPDNFTRNKVRGIADSQVRKVEITGPNYMRFENDPIVITDRKQIGALLDGLRRSVRYSDSDIDLGQADTLSVYVRHRPEPITFDFSPRHPDACFGPILFTTIKKLAKYEWHPKHSATP